MIKNAKITTNHISRKELAPTLRSKGKGAFSTENRRLTWDIVVWPMLLHLNRPYFTLDEFRIKRSELCRKYRVKGSNIRGGLLSLTHRGFLVKNNHTYSINLKLLPYLNKKVNLDYSRAFRKMVAKY